VFLQINDKIINLKNVSNINILRNNNRIIFNLNYNIELHDKIISDYVYLDTINEDDMKDKLDYLYKDEYFKENFIKQNKKNGYININEISSIKFIKNKNRVIFNLAHPVTFKKYNGDKHITSEFVFVNCINYNEYVKYVQYIYKVTGIIQGE